jgi:predicted DNA-binding transcriptional regulator AlpA
MSNLHFDKNDRLLCLREVLDIVRISKATLYREMSAGRFPLPVKLFGSRVCWLESEVLGFVSLRLADRVMRNSNTEVKNERNLSI